MKTNLHAPIKKSVGLDLVVKLLIRMATTTQMKLQPMPSVTFTVQLAGMLIRWRVELTLAHGRILVLLPRRSRLSKVDQHTAA